MTTLAALAGSRRRGPSPAPVVEGRLWNTTDSLLYTSPSGHLIHRLQDGQVQVAEGMQPLFPDVASNGHLAVAVIQRTGSQVSNTGLTMSAAFWDPTAQAWYEVLIPTTTGATSVPAANAITGVYEALGGADTSDAVAGQVAGTPVVFLCSALPYKSWRISTYGLWPVIAAFTLDAGTGRWVYDQARSIFTADLAASDPTHWRPLVNVWGETYYESRGPVEMAWLPASNMIACSLYFPMPTKRSGAVCVIDPATKTQQGYYELPELTTAAGKLIWAFPRDIVSDPTGAAGGEVFNIIADCTKVNDERILVGIAATGGSWSLTYNGNTTASIPWGSSSAVVQAALEALPGIGAGNVEVTKSLPFLTETYAEYDVEFIGALTETNLSTVTLNKGGLTDGTTSALTQLTNGGASNGHFPFLAMEFEWDATTDTLAPITVPYHCLGGGEVPSDRPERYPRSWSMAHYTPNGDLVIASTITETLTSAALHIFRKVAGARALDTAIAPTAGWESRVGEARIAGDVVTAAGAQSVAAAPGIITDATGRIYTVGRVGRLNRITPETGWAFRSAELLTNPTLAANATGWSAKEGGHAVTWSSSDGGRAVLTAGAAGPATIRTAVGTAGIALPVGAAGQEIQCRIDLRAGSVERMVQVFLTYYDAGGVPVATLEGYGPGGFVRTSGYRTFRWSTVVPASAVYVAINAELAGVANGEAFYVNEASLRLPPFTTTYLQWDDTVMGNTTINKAAYDPARDLMHVSARKGRGDGINYDPVIITAHLARW